MELETTDDTTALSYWLNWRFLLCVIWVFTPTVGALLMICKYEDSDHFKSLRGDAKKDLRGDEAWRPCLKVIHPLWLLAYRVIAFSLLLTTLISKVVISGAGVYYYYTHDQWPLYPICCEAYVLSVDLYLAYNLFGCGSLLSIYGCFWYNEIRSMDLGVHHVESDAENGSYIPLAHEENGSSYRKETYVPPVALKCSYAFQALFQMNAGAVMLTDCIYWLIIFPFLTIKYYNMSFVTVIMHTVNAIFLIGDALSNCLFQQVPLVRISLFVLWTGAFVIFQWTIHTCVSIWWPYPFLDLYLLVAVLHVPSYGLFTLVVKVKASPIVKMVSSYISMLRSRYDVLCTTDEFSKIHICCLS